MKIEEKLSKMVQVKTVSVSAENRVFTEFHNLINELFPNFVNVCKFENINGLLLYKWEGKKHTNPIMFMNHHDVVEANKDAWIHEPFKGTIDNGKLYGRGTLDTKGGLCCMLEAAENLIKEGFVPSTDIYFCSDNSEEINGENAEKCSLILKDRNIEFSMIIDEGGMILDEPVSGALGRYAMVGVGEKGCSDLKFVARSNGGHGSTPFKNTPWIRLSKFMLDVENNNLFEVKATNTNLELFKRLSKTMKGFKKFILSNSRFFKGFIEKVFPRLSNTLNAMLRTTICFTTSFSGNQQNSIPKEAWVNGNMRFSTHQGLESSIKELEKIANKYDIEIVRDNPHYNTYESPFDSFQFKLIEKAVNETYPNTITAPYIMTGASDARYFPSICKNVYRFVPFLIDDNQLSSIHGNNENVDISSLNKAVDFYRILMEQDYE